MTKPRVVCLVGPTGVGKSAIALRLAGQFNGEIINADSRQVFEAFPIITAQPSQAEQAALPHRLYGFLKTDARFSRRGLGGKGPGAYRTYGIPCICGRNGIVSPGLF